MGTTLEVERRSHYLVNWTSCQRHFGKSVEEYVERFKAEILRLAPPDESQNDLIWLFKKGFPHTIRTLFMTSINSNSVEAVINEALEISSSLDIDKEVPKCTPTD